MADWVHCNRCTKKYSAQTTLYLVECGHIFCQRCIEKTNATKKCLMCGKSGNVLPLNKDLDQNVLDYFQPIEALMKRTLEVYKFQLQHRQSVTHNLMNKFEHAKKEWINLNNQHKELMKQNNLLRDMLPSSGKNVQRFPSMTSTPVPHAADQSMSFQNTSMLSSIPPHMVPTRYDNPKMYPGYAKKPHIFSSGSGASGSSHRPSPLQMVPLRHPKAQELPMIHRGSLGRMQPLDQFRRSGGSGKSH